MGILARSEKGIDMVIQDCGHHADITPREEVTAKLIELLALIESQRGQMRARRYRTCRNLLRDALVILAPEIEWNEAAAMAGLMARDLA